MINLEQVKLLETKVAKAVDYVERVAGENAVLLQKEADMLIKLEANHKRIDELEALIMRFKEEQGQIENGILAALGKLSRLEEEMDKSLKGKSAGGKGSAAKDTAKPAAHSTAVKPAPVPAAKPAIPAEAAPGPGGGEICFEIPENDAGDDIIDPLGGADPLENEPEDPLTNNRPEGDGELEIF